MNIPCGIERDEEINRYLSYIFTLINLITRGYFHQFVKNLVVCLDFMVFDGKIAKNLNALHIFIL